MAKKLFKVINGIAIETQELRHSAFCAQRLDTRSEHYRAVQRDYDELDIVSDVLPQEHNVALSY